MATKQIIALGGKVFSLSLEPPTTTKTPVVLTLMAADELDAFVYVTWGDGDQSEIQLEQRRPSAKTHYYVEPGTYGIHLSYKRETKFITSVEVEEETGDIEFADLLQTVFQGADQRLQALRPELKEISIMGGELEIEGTITEIRRGRGFRLQNIMEQKVGRTNAKFYWQSRPDRRRKPAQNGAKDEPKDD